LKILITGGAGFIGSNLIIYMIKKTQHELIIFDKLTYAGDPLFLKEISKSTQCTVIEGDICDIEKLAEVFRKFKPDAVMNLAAESHVDKSITNASDFLNTNIMGTYNLLEVSRQFFQKYNKSNFRFHHISTDEVFGDLAQDTGKFTTDTAYKPSSPYAASKASSDHLVRAWSRTYGLPTIISNCSNNYGPRQYPEKLIPYAILCCLKQKQIPVYGDGSQIRDWLHVDDHVIALELVLRKGRVGETYLVGGCNEVTNIEVVHMICDHIDIYKSDKFHSHTKLISYVKDRAGHDLRYAIDSSKLKNELSWKPSLQFEEGIEKTVAWYLENKEWMDNIKTGDYQKY